MKTAYFDAFCGASGDMIVGALIDAGAPFDVLKTALESLGVDGFHLAAEKVIKQGIQATQFHVHVAHHDHHHHPHRHLADILDIIEESDLPVLVKAQATETFRRIGACEAHVHGTTIDQIHFHEVGAVDSIVDIIGANFALHLLGIERVICSPLHVGSGTIEVAHGVLPVPAPATALLLKDVPFYATEVQGELVTPTGAALLTQWSQTFGPMPAMRTSAIGYGCGTRELPGRANVLRVLIGETAATLPQTESISVLEANIDDMNPEWFPVLVNDLLAKGARDAFLTPLLGKKGRPAFLVTVLCDEERVGELLPILFASSTTFGVRVHQEQRVCLDREWKTVSTPWGDIRIKAGRFQGILMSASPEFEDCRAAAEKHGVPLKTVYLAAQVAAQQGVSGDA